MRKRGEVSIELVRPGTDDAATWRFSAATVDAISRATGRPAEDVDHLLTFVVVGAGPTGVEMAGAIADRDPDQLNRTISEP